MFNENEYELLIEQESEFLNALGFTEEWRKKQNKDTKKFNRKIAFKRVCSFLKGEKIEDDGLPF